MKIVKLFIDAVYSDRQSYNNKLQEIIELPENFDKQDIVNKISALRYSEGYTIKKIEILMTREKED